MVTFSSLRTKELCIEELIWARAVYGAHIPNPIPNPLPPGWVGCKDILSSDTAQLSFVPNAAPTFTVNMDSGTCTDSATPSWTAGPNGQIVTIDIHECIGGCPYGTDWVADITASYCYDINDGDIFNPGADD